MNDDPVLTKMHAAVAAAIAQMMTAADMRRMPDAGGDAVGRSTAATMREIAYSGCGDLATAAAPAATNLYRQR